MEKLYGWLFTYNPYTGKWIACKREDYFLLFSDQSSLLKSSSIETLQTLIIKTEGKLNEINSLIAQSG